MTELWVAGQHMSDEGGDDWLIIGIFSSRELALEQCEYPQDFIAPWILDSEPSDQTEEWVGYCRPYLNA